jgi:hypothetical protein
MPFYTLTLTTTSPHVAIESRWQPGSLYLESIDRQAWPIIERCAGSKIDATPPLG